MPAAIPSSTLFAERQQRRHNIQVYSKLLGFETSIHATMIKMNEVQRYLMFTQVSHSEAILLTCPLEKDYFSLGLYKAHFLLVLL